MIVYYNTHMQVLVFGDYTLEVTVQSYSLDTGFFGCCDDDRPRGSRNTCTRCNTYFQYCLLPFGTTTSSRQPLTCAPIASSIPSGNGAFIDFSQSTVLGLPNPLVFNGISSSWTVSNVYFLLLNSMDCCSVY